MALYYMPFYVIVSSFMKYTETILQELLFCCCVECDVLKIIENNSILHLRETILQDLLFAAV